MTATVDLSAYRTLYLQTAREQLSIIRKGLLMVRLNPNDVESLKNIHISAHSIKGQSLAMGYQKTALCCRLIEYIFRDALEKKLQFTSELVSAIKDTLDKVSDSLAAVEKTGVELDLTSTEQNLEKLSGVKLPPAV